MDDKNPKQNHESWREYERRLNRAALELTKDWPPEANLSPVRFMVELADRYGWKIVQKDDV